MVLKPLAKILLIALTSPAAALATYAAIQKNVYQSDMITLIISNKDMKGIITLVKSLENLIYR